MMLLSFAIAAALSSCKEEIEIGGISLEVSSTEIAADGVEAAVFTVKSDAGEDVTSKAMIMNQSENSVVRNARFQSDVPGVYVFYASLNGIKSEEVAVRVGSGFSDGDGETQMVTTDVITPVRYAEGRHYGSSTATAIDVVRAESGKDGAVLQFTCIPGSEVKSYRVQVYPLSWIYNQLLEFMKGEGKESLSVADANDALRSLITNESYEALAGQLMNRQTLGSNWFSSEFDWLNTNFEKAWSIQPDSEYLIVTLSSFDENCSTEDSYASLAVCHFSTPEVQPEGSPSVSILPDPGFSSYILTYTANEDCKYMYYFSHDTKSIDEYIGFYGEKMFRDYIRHMGGSPVDMTEPYVVPVGANDILAENNTAIAVPMDQYGIPAEEYIREDFSLLEKPANTVLGKASISSFVTSSGVAKFHVEMDAHTSAVYQGIYTKEAAETNMAADLASKEYIAQTLLREGWGHANRNYRFSMTEGVLPESASYTDELAYWTELKPDTEYALLYVTRNGYGELSRLEMSEPFRTKPQQREISQTATYDPSFKFSLESLGVNGLKCAFSFDPSVVAQVYFASYDPVRDFEGAEYGYPNRQSDRDTWMYWMLDYREPSYGYPWPDNWATVDSPSGNMDSSIYDLTPGSHYKYACVYETWDGYMSDVQWADVTLQNISWGKNPQLTTRYEISRDKYQGEVYLFEFLGNSDIGQIMYIGAAVNDENSTAMGLYELLNSKDTYTEAEYITLARSRTISLGVNTPGNLSNFKVSTEYLSETDLYVVTAIGIGRDGEDNVYSDLAYYVWTKESGKFQTLSDYLK